LLFLLLLLGLLGRRFGGGGLGARSRGLLLVLFLFLRLLAGLGGLLLALLTVELGADAGAVLELLLVGEGAVLVARGGEGGRDLGLGAGEAAAREPPRDEAPRGAHPLRALGLGVSLGGGRVVGLRARGLGLS